jgi:restriction system protein
LEEELKQLIEELKVPLVEIDENRGYWLVRTQQGEHYQEFFLDDFVAIGWDELNNLEELNSRKEEDQVEKIREIYPDETRPRYVFNQIQRFINEIKIGDIVIIPSKSSKHLSFGRITSDVFTKEVTEEEKVEGACPFGKRRSVKWLKTVKRSDLDPYLYQLIYSQHTISAGNEYASYIDHTLHSFYKRGDQAYLVLNVKKQENIGFMNLAKMLYETGGLIDLFNKDTDSTLDKDEIDLKASLQSPGTLIFIAGGLTIAVLGLIFHFTMGGKFDFRASWKEISFTGENEGLVEKIMKFKSIKDNGEDNETKQQLKDMKKSLAKLEAEIPKELSPSNEEHQSPLDNLIMEAEEPKNDRIEKNKEDEPKDE